MRDPWRLNTSGGHAQAWIIALMGGHSIAMPQSFSFSTTSGSDSLHRGLFRVGWAA